MAVDSCFWTVQAEDLQENILAGAILVYNRYSEQSNKFSKMDGCGQLLLNILR